ncbi:outer membrane beta-barrel protein [Colwellia sp. MB3u-8]|nr:outer membrane beta-barrel protein [Colwellia sp. MB3u-8]
MITSSSIISSCATPTIYLCNLLISAGLRVEVIIASGNSSISNVEFEYSLIDLETKAKKFSNFHVLSGGYNWYYSNNLLLHSSIGAAIKEEDMEQSSGLLTGKERVLKYLITTDARYEYPISDEIATYAILGLTYVDFRTSNLITDEKHNSFGYRCGVGGSYVLSRNSAVFIEYKQEIKSAKIEGASWSIGYKLTL